MFRVTKESFEAQFKECVMQGNARRERTPDRKRHWTMCGCYGGFCKPNKCLEDRKTLHYRKGKLYRRF